LISFVILTHGKPLWFEKCLTSCLDQDYGSFEVIVVSDTPDSGGEIEEIIARQNDRGIRLVSVNPCGTGAARNIGVSAAWGDIIAFLDDDCVLPDSRWLSTMASKFDSSVDIVYALGKFHPWDPMIIRYGILCNPYFEGQGVGTAHTLIRRDRIIEAGGFILGDSEDLDLTSKIPGIKVFVPGCEVYHYHATTIRAYLRKQWRNISATQRNGGHGAQAPLKQLLKFRSGKFFGALLGKADPSWVLWPLIDGCSVIFILAAKVKTVLTE
jgi:glycosyltransferase involved in cell wall biosynthesis